MLGVSDEQNLVIELNKKENVSLWEILGLDPELHVAIHVNSKKKSNFHDKKILPKADVFIATGDIKQEYLEGKEYLLTEVDFKKLKLNPVHYSGISVKKENSKSYTITKISPIPFNAIFGSYELGCGISVFVDKNSDVELNESKIFKGWNTDIDSMIEFYSEYIPEITELKERIDITKQKIIYKKIKSFAKTVLKHNIDNSTHLQNFVFQGIGAFEEPYTAHYFYQNGVLSRDCYIPYYVDTGSGRHKGDFTVVIKPL